MAALASGGEPRVARLPGAAVVRLVAGVAVGRRSRIAAGMAVLAGRRAVGTVQAEARLVVVEVGRLPGRFAVAALAGVGEAGVAGVSRPVVVRLVAGVAIRRRSRVAAGVAVLAGCRAMRPVQPEARQVVIKGRRLPGRFAVAALAGVGEAGVAGISRPVVVPLVAGEAIRRRPRVAAGVAVLAGRRAVRPVEPKRRQVVVEVRRLPGRLPMAIAAGSRETRVAGILGAVEVALVAREAIRRRPRVAARVAVLAGRRAVRPVQPEGGLVVVELRRLPGRFPVAVAAGGGKPGVARVLGAVEVALVAREAIRRRSRVAARVAVLTGRRAVRPVQPEGGLVVVELRRLPGRFPVAVAAGGGKPGVARVLGAVEVALVAREAIRRRSRVAARVAVLAGRRAVRPVEPKSGLVVGELRRSPGNVAVAIGAAARETRVRWAERPFEVVAMAGDTVLARLCEAPRRVAARTAQRAVGACEVEPRHGMLERQGVGERLPALFGMAL